MLQAELGIPCSTVGSVEGAAALAVSDFSCPTVGYNCPFPPHNKVHIRLGACAAGASTTTTAVAVNRGAVNELLPLPVPALPFETGWSCSKYQPGHLGQPVSPCRPSLSRSLSLPPPRLSPADALHLQLVPRPGGQPELLAYSPAAVAECPVPHRALPAQPEAGTLPPPLLHGHTMA